jgi:hypothetical protein
LSDSRTTATVRQLNWKPLPSFCNPIVLRDFRRYPEARHHARGRL